MSEKRCARNNGKDMMDFHDQGVFHILPFFVHSFFLGLGICPGNFCDSSKDLWTLHLGEPSLESIKTGPGWNCFPWMHIVFIEENF